MIQTYFSKIKTAIDTFAKAPFVLDAVVNFETRSGEQGYLKGLITFIDGSRLHFREFLDADGKEVEKLAYSYHFEDAENALVFRYDNARHKPALGFLEHKHIAQDEIIQAASPDIVFVLDEIADSQDWI